MRYLLLLLSYLLVGVIAVFVGVQISTPEMTEIGNTPPPVIQPVSKPESGTPGLSFSDIAKQPTIFRQQFVAHQLAAVSNIPELKTYLDQTLSHQDLFYQMVLGNIFLERFIEVDVMGTISYLNHSGLDPEVVNQLLSNVLTTWIRHDPEAAIDYYRNIGDPQLKASIGMRFMQDSTLASSGLLAEVQEELGPFGEQIMNAARMRQSSPESLFHEALSMTGNDRQQQLTNALSRWMRSDPGAALQSLSQISNPQERRNMLRLLINMQSRLDPLSALQTARDYAPGDHRIEGQILSSLVAQNPELGLPYMEEYIERTGNSNILASAISMWARSDLNGALAYAQNLDKKYQRTVYMSLVHTYVQTDPDSGMRWAMSMEDMDIRRSAVGVLAQSNIELAEDWLEKINDSELNNSLIQSIVSAKAQIDPESAYDWLQDYEDSDGYHSALSSIVYQWSSQDPSRVAQLLEEHSDDNQMQHVFNHVASNWSQTDLDASVRWMNSLPDGDNKNAVAQQIVMSTFRHDQEQALELLAEVPNAQHLRMQLAYQWVAREPDAVEQIIRELDLSETEASQIEEHNAQRSRTRAIRRH